MTSERPIRAHKQHGVPADRYITSAYFTRTQIERLERLAGERSLSRSVLIREAVEAFLEVAGV